MNKRTLLIILFILAIIVFGFLIYYVFFREIVAPPTNNANVANVNVEIPTNLVGNANRVVTNVNAAENINAAVINANVPVVNVVPEPEPIARGGRTLAKTMVSDYALTPAVGSDGKSLIYYEPTKDKFYKISPDGKTKTELTDKKFPSVDKITWAPTKDKAIIEFPDNSKILYDFNDNKQTTLPDEWEDITFSPKGDQVAYEYITDNPDDNWLAIANPDGTQVQAIEPLGDKQDDVQVAWSPSNQVVALYRESIDAERQEVYFIGLYGENFKSLVTDGRGFEGIWSLDGNKILYSVYNAGSNFNPTLYIVDALGDNIGLNKKSLNVQTWSSKCTFSSGGTDVYCAVPNNLDVGSGFTPSSADNKADSFYKVNLQTGLKSILALPESDSGETLFTANSLFLSADEDYLYFTDRNTGKVYQIQLK